MHLNFKSLTFILFNFPFQMILDVESSQRQTGILDKKIDSRKNDRQQIKRQSVDKNIDRR